MNLFLPKHSNLRTNWKLDTMIHLNEQSSGKATKPLNPKVAIPATLACLPAVIGRADSPAGCSLVSDSTCRQSQKMIRKSALRAQLSYVEYVEKEAIRRERWEYKNKHLWWWTPVISVAKCFVICSCSLINNTKFWISQQHNDGAGLHRRYPSEDGYQKIIFKKRQINYRLT